MQTKLLAVDIKSLIKKIPFSHIVGCEGIYSHDLNSEKLQNTSFQNGFKFPASTSKPFY